MFDRAMERIPLPGRFRHQALLIAAVALTLNLSGNGRISLFDRDEPRYAACTREMAARNDWIFPTFNGEPRYHKPILIYWLMRGGFAVGGDNPFGARFVSSVAGMGTALVVLATARRRLGRNTAFLAALMLVTAPIVVVESKLATTDATLAFFLVSALCCLWELQQRDSRRLALLFWCLMALATLTKGPVGPAIVGAACLATRLLGGTNPNWQRLEPRWGIPLFLAVALPWYVTIGVYSDWDFYRFALGRELIHRVSTPMERHGGFPGYYLVTSIVTFHPWSALLPAALAGAWVRRRSQPDLAWLLGWVIGPLVLLECVQTKLVHYYLPAYPAAALLAAWLIEEVAEEGVNLRRWTLGRTGLGLLAGVGLSLAIILIAASVVLPSALRWPCLVGALILGVGTLVGMVWFQHARTRPAVFALATTWSLLLLISGAWLLPAAEPFRMAPVVGDALARLSANEGVEPMLLTFQEPSIVERLRRPAALVRDWKAFHQTLDQNGTVATALLPHEIRELRGHREFELDLRDAIEGVNLNTGARQVVTLALVRRREPRSPEVVVRTGVVRR